MNELSRLKVDQLKIAIGNFNETFYSGSRNLKISGNKQELVSNQLARRYQSGRCEGLMAPSITIQQVTRIKTVMLQFFNDNRLDQVIVCKNLIIRAGGG